MGYQTGGYSFRFLELVRSYLQTKILIWFLICCNWRHGVW